MVATAAKVTLWGKTVGAVAWDDKRKLGTFEYDPSFVSTGLEIAPGKMPLRAGLVYSFPGLNKETFKGLPACLADSLPDDFGNALIDAWLATQGRDKASFNPVERLLYTGSRGMGALEFEPGKQKGQLKSESVDIDSLVQLAAKMLSDREGFTASLNEGSADDHAMAQLLQIGTSAGGARPKAVIAISPAGDDIRSGQVMAPAGYSYWLLKFDMHKDAPGLGDTQGYGRIEYAYSKMAQAAGINMMETRLLEEGGRAHFMTKRFDRSDQGEKIHMLTLCAMAHADLKRIGEFSYAEVFSLMRQLKLSRDDAEDMFRRMVFNVIARNQDDHTKNTAFLMGVDGVWRLSPAYDLSWSYDPTSKWVAEHAMTINGKRDNFVRSDLVEAIGAVKNFKPEQIIDEVIEAVSNWPVYAAAAGVPEKTIKAIRATHRLYLAKAS